MNSRSLLPGGAVAHHGVQDSEQFPHTGDQGYLLRLPRCEKPLVAASENGVPTSSYQRSHVKRCAHPCPPAPNGATAPVLAAVAIKGGDSHQRGNLSAVKPSQFRHLRQKHRSDRWPDARDTAQEPFLGSPQRTLADGAIQLLLQMGQLFFQTRDVLPDQYLDGRLDRGEAQPLRGQNLHHPAWWRDQRSQHFSLRVWKRPRQRAPRLGQA